MAKCKKHFLLHVQQVINKLKNIMSFTPPDSVERGLPSVTLQQHQEQEQSTMTGWANLPAELIIKILCDLNLESLLACKQVSRQLNKLANAAELLYKVELAVAGMEDGYGSALTITDRRKRLAEHQAAWRDLRWRSEEVVPMLHGGVWELYGGVLAQGKERETLVFKQIPSQIKDIEGKEWEINLGFRIRDFGIDPSQDLLVVIEHPNVNGMYRIHLLALSTGKKHPKANDATMVFRSPEPERITFAIQVCEEYLGILFIGTADDSESVLLIWNWHTGTVELSLHGRELSSFSFLSHSQILVAFIFSVFLEDPQPPPSLLAIDFIAQSSEPVNINDIDYEGAFDFPEMLADGAALSLSIRSDPAPTWRPNTNVPFYTARQERLFVMTLWVAEGANITTLVLFVPTSTILSHLPKPATEDSKRRFAWDEWGPSGTRMCMAPAGHSMVWVCYVSGLSFVAPYRNGNQVLEPPMGPKMVQLFDFNQLAIQHQLANQKEDDEGAMKIVTGPSEVPVQDVFINPIRTSLPYRWKANRVPYNPAHTFDAVMLGEDAIVTVTSEPGVREYRILSF